MPKRPTRRAGVDKQPSPSSSTRTEGTVQTVIPHADTVDTEFVDYSQSIADLIIDPEYPVGSATVEMSAGMSKELADGTWVRVDVRVSSTVQYSQINGDQAHLAKQAAASVSLDGLGEFIDTAVREVKQSRALGDTKDE